MADLADKEQQQDARPSGEDADVQDADVQDADVRGDGAGDVRQEPAEEAPSRARRVLRYALFAAGGLIGLVVLVVLVVLLLLQTDWGARKAVDLAIDLANPYEDATLAVGGVDGSWVSGLSLYDVNLTREDGVRMAHLDTLRLRYDLLPLLSRRLEVGEVYLSGPDLNLHQRSDSTWDLLAPFSDTTAVEDTSGGFAVQVDEITLRNASLSAAFYAGGRDSTLRVDNLNARVEDLLIDEGIAVNVDTLYGQYEQTGLAGPVELGLGAQLQENRFTLSGLRLDSPRSDVRGAGTLRLPEGESDTVDDIDFTLQASPLSFRDLRPFAPSLAPEGSMTLDVRARGSGRLVDADVQARFSDGGTPAGRLTLEAEVTPTTEGPLQYRAEGALRDLDLDLFTAGATSGTAAGAAPDTTALAGTVSANLDVDLEGASLDDLSGTANVIVFDTQIGDLALDRTSLQTQFTDGQAQIDLESGLRGLAVALNGTLRPFADQPGYDLEGRLQSLDIGRFLEGSTQQSDLNLALSLEGEGADLQTTDATARLALAPSTLNGYALQGDVDVRLSSGGLLFDLRLDLEDGLIAADGAVDLGDVPAYRISQGRFENVDAAALAGDTTRSSLTGTFTLEGRGTDPEALRLQTALNLSDSFYGPYEINDAGLEAVLRGGRLQAALDAALDGGTFRLAATARPFAATPAFAVTEGAFRNIDAGELTGNPAQRSDLSGTFTLEARGTDPETMTLQAQLGLRDSQLNQQAIESARAAVELRRGDLAYRFTLDLPQGTTVLAGTARPFAEPMTYAVREGAFNSLDLGALLGNPSLTTDLSGTLSLDGRGTDPETMMLQARLDLDRSRVNDAMLTGGFAEAALRDGRADVTSTLDLGEGRIQLRADGRFLDEAPTYAARGDIENLNLAAFLGADSLQSEISLGFEVEGEGTDLATMDVRGQVASDGLSYGSVLVDLVNVRFRASDGLVRVDTLLLRSNIAEATGGGQIALAGSVAQTSDFALTVDLTSLEPVEELAGADILSLTESQIQARVYGRPGMLRFEATADLNGLIYNTTRLAGLDARVAGELAPDRSLRAAEGSLELGYLAVGGFNVESSSFEASYAGADQEIGFEAHYVIDPGRDGRLVGTVDLRPENQRVMLETFGLRFGEDNWELLQEASIAYGDAYRVSNFLLYTDSPEGGDQQIAVDGVVDPDGEQNLVVTIEGFRLDAVIDLFSFDLLGGTLDGSIDLTGPASAPNLDGALEVDIQSSGRDVGELNLQLAYDSLQMRVDALLTHIGGSTLSAEGTLPLDLRLSAPASDSGAAAQDAAQGTLLTTTEVGPGSEVHFTIVADSFSIGWVQPFLDPATVDQLGGLLVADIDIGGTLDSPVLDGTAGLIGGRVALPELGATYRGIEADVTFQENQVILDRLRVRSGEGDLTGEGRIDLAELTLGEFDLAFDLDEFLAIDSREYRAVVGGTLAISGTTEFPVLTGDLDVLSADVYLVEEAAAAPAGIEDVALSPEEVQAVEERFGVRVSAADTTTSDAFLALEMDVHVSMERDLWIRSQSNPELQIQFTGRLDVQKEPGEEMPQVFGAIEVLDTRSYVSQFGKRFDITNGEIRFNGPVTAPTLDLEAAYEVPSNNNPEGEVLITLSISGNLEQLGTDEEDRVQFELGSDPQLSQSDIACYLALGRPCSTSPGAGNTEGGGGGLGGAATNLALGQVAGLVEGLAGSELGLDVIEIEQDGLRGATLTAGKYLSRRLYAALRQPISFSSGSARGSTSEDVATELIIEYEVFKWLLVRLSRDGSVLRGNLLWQYAY